MHQALGRIAASFAASWAGRFSLRRSSASGGPPLVAAELDLAKAASGRLGRISWGRGSGVGA